MIRIFIRQTFQQPEDVTVRKWRTITRAAHEAQARRWFRLFFPLHFKPGAEQRYGYQHRSERYLRFKRNGRRLRVRAEQLRKGQNRDTLRKAIEGGASPLVFTGHMRQMLKGSAEFRGFPTRGRVTMQAPVYAPSRRNTFTGIDAKGRSRKASRQPDKIAELTTVIPEEGADLSQFLDAQVAEGVRRHRVVKSYSTK